MRTLRPNELGAFARALGCVAGSWLRSFPKVAVPTATATDDRIVAGTIDSLAPHDAVIASRKECE